MAPPQSEGHRIHSKLHPAIETRTNTLQRTNQTDIDIPLDSSQSPSCAPSQVHPTQSSPRYHIHSNRTYKHVIPLPTNTTPPIINSLRLLIFLTTTIVLLHIPSIAMSLPRASLIPWTPFSTTATVGVVGSVPPAAEIALPVADFGLVVGVAAVAPWLLARLLAGWLRLVRCVVSLLALWRCFGCLRGSEVLDVVRRKLLWVQSRKTRSTYKRAYTTLSCQLWVHTGTLLSEVQLYSLSNAYVFTKRPTFK